MITALNFTFDQTLPQGISPGCSDVYGGKKRFLIDQKEISISFHTFFKAHLSCQYIDMTDMEAKSSQGREFFLRLTVNPEMKIAEQKYDNNMMLCKIEFDVDQLFVSVSDCQLSLPYIPGF